jgi:hypothetical protein
MNQLRRIKIIMTHLNPFRQTMALVQKIKVVIDRRARLDQPIALMLVALMLALYPTPVVLVLQKLIPAFHAQLLVRCPTKFLLTTELVQLTAKSLQPLQSLTWFRLQATQNMAVHNHP